MANKRKQFDQEFIKNAIAYRKEHADLTVKKCADNLGIGESTLNKWLSKDRNNQLPVGSGHCADPKDEEIARLKRELKNKSDALEILKKAISILGS